jgi:hypothetical protein
MDSDERIDSLEEAIEHLTQAAELVRWLRDPTLNAYVLPQLEGADSGWLGMQTIDYLRAALTDARESDAAPVDS